MEIEEKIENIGEPVFMDKKTFDEHIKQEKQAVVKEIFDYVSTYEKKSRKSPITNLTAKHCLEILKPLMKKYKYENNL